MFLIRRTCLAAMLVTVPTIAFAELDESQQAARDYEACIVEKLSFYTVKPTKVLCSDELARYLATVPNEQREKIKRTILHIYQDLDTTKHGE